MAVWTCIFKNQLNGNAKSLSKIIVEVIMSLKNIKNSGTEVSPRVFSVVFEFFMLKFSKFRCRFVRGSPLNQIFTLEVIFTNAFLLYWKVIPVKHVVCRHWQVQFAVVFQDHMVEVHAQLSSLQWSPMSPPPTHLIGRTLSVPTWRNVDLVFMIVTVTLPV